MADPVRYQRDINAGLDRAFGDPATEELALDLRTARLAIFSDMHRGARDGADDFQRCERAYAAALGAYLETGHRLIVLGDAEELWENRPDGVLAAYEDVLRLEAEFHRAGRYERFWGNHDDEWRYGGQVRRRLGRFLSGLRVREALKLRVSDGGGALGLLFLVHGHQGRLDSAMFSWAREHPERPVLIAGHTHHPVFGTSRPSPPPAPVVPPCYFNTGCCCFGDGDITGLEIADGEIRLVRWPDEEGRPRARVLARADMREVLRTVAHATR